MFQTRKGKCSVFLPCDAIDVTLLMHGFASLIAGQINSQIYGLIAEYTIQSVHKDLFSLARNSESID
jgi:hypothetical protein